MRIVLDTNIIVSSYLTPRGRVARLIALWEQGAFDLLVSEAIVAEYVRVLGYPRHRKKHHLTDAQISEIGEGFREFSELVAPDETPAIVKNDPDDDHFLACADCGEADCLVTGDPHLLEIGWYKGMPILKPADFIAQFFPEQVGCRAEPPPNR